MSDEIKTNVGRKIGEWSGMKVTDLQDEISRIRSILSSENSAERLIAKEMPHRDQLPKDLHTFKAYHIWGCDLEGNCLVGTHANRIESIEKVRTYSLIDHH